jgi:hypothetical protein
MHRPTDHRPADMRPADKTAIFCLTFVALASSLLFGAARIGWLPAWTGAAISFGALLGILLVFRRAGALRTRFLALFVAALAAAALYGWLVAPHV